MAAIVIRPLKIDTTDEQIVQLQIVLSDTDFAGLFDQLEVWRSRDTSSGPYEELTADSWTAARIPKDAGDQPASPVTGASAVLVGVELALKLDEKDDLSIVFTGSNPLTYAQAATQITDQSLGKLRSYVDADGVLVIETTEAGTGAALRILESDAAPLLGLPLDEPESLAFGHDARLSLKSGTASYTFTDRHGSSDYFYKTRFRSRTAQGFSEFSQPFHLGKAPGVSASNTACGQLQLVGQDGQPLGNVEVTVSNSFKGDLVEGRLVAGGSLRRLTDANGQVEFFLVRGLRATVAISGTSIVRDIVVPTDPNILVFPLLGAKVSPVDDVFKVQVPDLVYAERRSL
jgi:hypothetical protein